MSITYEWGSQKTFTGRERIQMIDSKVVLQEVETVLQEAENFLQET